MFEKVLKLIKQGVGEAYPGAAVAIGVGDKVLTKQFFDVDKDTLFDLASLSKLVSTTFIALKLIDQGKLSLDDKIGNFLEYTGNYSDCEIKHLLTHTSGIPTWLPLFDMKINQADALKTILNSKRCSQTGEKVSYSCMGYIVLAHILEKVGGDSLDNLAQNIVFNPLKMANACYNPDKEKVCAPTEWYAGKVHDENALFLGGVSGNAGVFATLDDIINFAKMCALNGGEFINKNLFENAIKNHTPDCEESRGLGFKLEGDLFGHTGFTGTSLFIDKNTRVWGILLTNAVNFGRDKSKYLDIKNKFYDMIITEYKEEK